MFCISIWKFLSLYESVFWNIIFLRCCSFFCRIIWNFFSFFILEECYNLSIDMSCISVPVCYCFYITILRNIFLRCCSIFAWISFNWISIFIYKFSIWAYCWCVFSINVFTIYIFTNYYDSSTSSYIIFFWGKCNFTFWSNCVSTFSWYYFCCFSTFKCRRYSLINITFEYWCS